jgi:hypothetical protein
MTHFSNTRFNKEEQLAMLSEALKNAQPSGNIDAEEIQRRIEKQYAMVKEMQRFLDKFLKN